MTRHPHELLLESYIPTQAWNFRVDLTHFISLSYLANLAKFLSDAKKTFFNLKTLKFEKEKTFKDFICLVVVLLLQNSQHLRRILERCLTCDRKWIHGKISCWLKFSVSLSWPQQCTVGKHGGLDVPVIKQVSSFRVASCWR